MPNEETIAAPPDELDAERKQVERDHLCPICVSAL
jgi:hypothetical protein